MTLSKVSFSDILGNDSRDHFDTFGEIYIFILSKMTFLKVLINGNSFFWNQTLQFMTITSVYFGKLASYDSKRPRIFFCLCDFLCQRTISVGLKYAQSLGLF